MEAPSQNDRSANIKNAGELLAELSASLHSNALSNWGRAAVNLGLLLVAIAYAVAYFLTQGCGS